MLWTKSRMAMREAEPALQAMVEAGCAVMLIKGASRIAVNASAQRGRVAHDIDILVRLQDMTAAFDVLRERDWQIATGVSPHYLRTRLASVRSMNFFTGSFGDIDLHQLAYDGSQQSAEDDLAIWQQKVQPLRSMSHVHCKLSGLVTEAVGPDRRYSVDNIKRYLDAALEIFGTQRVMFGSDWPVCLLAAPSYAAVYEIVREWASRLSPSDQQDVFGGTAQRCYGLAV